MKESYIIIFFVIILIIIGILIKQNIHEGFVTWIPEYGTDYEDNDMYNLPSGNMYPYDVELMKTTCASSPECKGFIENPNNVFSSGTPGGLVFYKSKLENRNQNLGNGWTFHKKLQGTTPPGTTSTGTTRTTPPGTTSTGTTRTTPPGTTSSGTTRTTPPGTTSSGTTRTTPPGTTSSGTTRTTPPGTTLTGTTRTTPPGTTSSGTTRTTPPGTTIPPITTQQTIVDESLLNKTLSKTKTYINSILSGYFPTEVGTGSEDTLIEKDYVQNYKFCNTYNNRIPSITGQKADGSYIYGNCTNICSMNGNVTARLYNSVNDTCI
jgi:hypothetical protein